MNCLQYHLIFPYKIRILVFWKIPWLRENIITTCTLYLVELILLHVTFRNQYFPGHEEWKFIPHAESMLQQL